MRLGAAEGSALAQAPVGLLGSEVSTEALSMWRQPLVVQPKADHE